MTFSELYNILLLESPFRKRKTTEHLFDVPMFSIFLDKNVPFSEKFKKQILDNLPTLKKIFADARNQIHRLGFKSMHCNVNIKDLSSLVNHITGTGIGGQAYKTYMEIDLGQLINPSSYLATTIVHEWAHIWMSHNGNQFREAVCKLYDAIKNKFLSHPSAREQYNKHTHGQTLKALIFLKEWDSKITNILYDNRIIRYLLPKIKITENHIPFLPHQFSLPVYLNDEVTLSHYQNGHKTIPANTELNALKINGEEWIIELYENHTRWDKIITTKDLFILTDKNKFIENINNVIRTHAYYTENKMSKKEILQYMIDDITNTLKRIYDIYIKNFDVKNNPPKEHWKPLAEKWTTEYIFPQLLKVWASKKKLKECSTNRNIIYDILWTNNEFKPGDVSVTQEFTSAFDKSMETYEDPELKFMRNLNGSDKQYLRKLAQDLEMHHSDYGIANSDELWATSIDNFFKLSTPMKREIVKLISY